MPIQVKPKHHPRIATLVAQAKANDPERTWTSALLAEYVNEHYGDGIKFHTATKDKGSLTKHMTTKKLVDDDAKVGDKLKAAYGVTDLAVASMNDLTQPLYEDPHDPELVTGYASVLVDWATKLPRRNFYVYSRRFKTQREAYVHAVSMLGNMARHEGQADQIDFAAVDPNDDTLRDEVLAAVQAMGARTVSEEPQEVRRDIYPGVSAVKMERDCTRVVYATPPSGGRGVLRRRFLATDIEEAKRYADQNVDVRRRAENREVSHEIATGKITEEQAMVGMRAPTAAVEAPLPDEEDDATAPPPIEGDSDDEPLEKLAGFDSWEEFKAARDAKASRSAAAESSEDDDVATAPPPAEADETEMDVEPPQDAAATPPSEPAAQPSPPNGPDRDTAGSSGAARLAHAINAHAHAPALPPRLNGMVDACADDAAAPLEESLADVVAERDELRRLLHQERRVLERRDAEVGLLTSVLADMGVDATARLGRAVDLDVVEFGDRALDLTRDAAARKHLPASLSVATEDFRDEILREEANHQMWFNLIGVVVDLKFMVHASIFELLWQALGTRRAAQLLYDRALREIGQFNYERLVERINALAVATGLKRRFIERRLGVELPENKYAKMYVESDELWVLDFLIPGPEVSAAGLVLRPANFAMKWKHNINLDELVRYAGYGRFSTAATFVGYVSSAARNDERVGAKPVYVP